MDVQLGARLRAQLGAQLVICSTGTSTIQRTPLEKQPQCGTAFDVGGHTKPRPMACVLLQHQLHRRRSYGATYQEAKPHRGCHFELSLSPGRRCRRVGVRAKLAPGCTLFFDAPLRLYGYHRSGSGQIVVGHFLPGRCPRDPFFRDAGGLRRRQPPFVAVCNRIFVAAASQQVHCECTWLWP